jgi:hypothetical protein
MEARKTALTPPRHLMADHSQTRSSVDAQEEEIPNISIEGDEYDFDNDPEFQVATPPGECLMSADGDVAIERTR